MRHSMMNQFVPMAGNSFAANDGKTEMSQPHQNSDQLHTIKDEYEGKQVDSGPTDRHRLPEPIVSSEDESLIRPKQGKPSHLDEKQINKPRSYSKLAMFDSDEEEELGALIYKSSRTAKMRAEANLAKVGMM